MALELNNPRRLIKIATKQRNHIKPYLCIYVCIHLSISVCYPGFRTYSAVNNSFELLSIIIIFPLKDMIDSSKRCIYIYIYIYMQYIFTGLVSYIHTSLIYHLAIEGRRVIIWRTLWLRSPCPSAENNHWSATPNAENMMSSYSLKLLF